MMIKSENQLLSIDESCLSDLSDENESTISGGTFCLSILSLIFSWCAPKPVYVAPPAPVCPPPAPVCPPPAPVCEPPKATCW